jgi:transcriptional regulator with XRE-family HTH domain
MTSSDEAAEKGNRSALPSELGDDESDGVARSANDQQARKTLAHKLDHLFRTFHPRGRGEYSFEEVAQAIADREGSATISATYLWMLRKGMRDNPTKRHLEALASFFGIPPAYLLDSDDEQAASIEGELEMLRAFRDSGVRDIALRAQDLSPKSLRTIAEMLDRVRELEGLSGPVNNEPSASAPKPAARRGSRSRANGKDVGG